MFARDRDLWAMEPNLFTDVRFTSQRTLSDASVALAADGVTLTLSDTTASAAGLGVGSVIDLSGLGLTETVSVTSDTVLTVSRLRADRDGDPLQVTDQAWTGTADGWTFAPQIGVVHRALLAALALDPPGYDTVSGVTAAAVLNPSELAQVESLGALHTIYAAVAPMAPPDAPIRRKAHAYSERFDAARRSARAVLDLNGDGQPDATRLITLNNLRRA